MSRNRVASSSDRSDGMNADSARHGLASIGLQRSKEVHSCRAWQIRHVQLYDQLGVVGILVVHLPQSLFQGEEEKWVGGNDDSGTKVLPVVPTVEHTQHEVSASSSRHRFRHPLLTDRGGHVGDLGHARFAVLTVPLQCLGAIDESPVKFEEPATWRRHHVQLLNGPPTLKNRCVQELEPLLRQQVAASLQAAYIRQDVGLDPLLKPLSQVPCGPNM
mmetsp:Transcript_42974/g.113229  ORF Transcript_42974/g.113229 Transcript_42974/m.113229 type:complete len:217 (-) Transcript_42974:723-1373(-)